MRGDVDPLSSSLCAPWHYSLIFIIAWEMVNHGKPNTLAFFCTFGLFSYSSFKLKPFMCNKSGSSSLAGCDEAPLMVNQY